MNENLKVLIVEDEIIIAEDLKISLQELGYDVLAMLQNADSVLTFLEKQIPDIIIMDIMLEGEMNGIELSQIINQQYDIPIIYCSAYNDIETVDQAVLTNPYGYILKPIDERELRATIKITMYKKEMTKKLKKSEERWQFALQGSGDAVWDWNIPANEIFYSSQWEKLIGPMQDWQYSKIEKWKKYIHPNDFPEVWNELQAHLEGKTDIFIAEYRMIMDSGQVIWVLNRAKVMTRNEQQKPLRMIGTISDIRERKKIEQTIIQSEKKYRTLVETMSEGIAIVNEGEQFMFANKAANSIFGVQHLEGKNLADFVTPEELENIKKQTLKRKNHKDGQYEVRITNAKKQEKILFVKVKAMFEHGKFTGSFGIFRDITEQRKYEAEMIKQARLESLGILAGGIAHDFNNLLTAILSNIEFAKLNLKNQTILQRTLEESGQAIQQAKTLTGQLLTFAKGGEPVIRIVDIAQLLQDTADFVLRGSNVIANLQIQEEIYFVLADEGQLHQVINNLLINARQAMPEGGVITISASTAQYNENTFVEIVIQDSGKGIPPEILPRIFDPFYTTKEEGTGLGLSTSYSIIKKHQGSLKIESKVNEGTKITIRLPATKEKVEKKSKPSKTSQQKSYNILLLDDNEMILRVTKEMLTQFGHKVAIAKTGKDAIEMYKKEWDNHTPYDLMILDLTIPNGLGGKEVLEKLLPLNPQLKAIVSSGYSSAPIISNYQNHGFSGAISKPYQVEDILQVISDVMEKR